MPSTLPSPVTSAPDQRSMFARLPSVLRFTGLGRSTIYRMIAAREFPGPVKLGPPGGRLALVGPRYLERDPASHHALTLDDGLSAMALIHPPNTIAWQIGDYVIHDADAKRHDMLMIVVGRSKARVHRTRYAFPTEQPRSWRRTVWRNTLALLHDPRRFGIDAPPNPLTPALSVSAPPPSATTPQQPGPRAKS